MNRHSCREDIEILMRRRRDPETARLHRLYKFNTDNRTPIISEVTSKRAPIRTIMPLSFIRPAQKKIM